ncbi:glycosyltransferase family 4 protein [Hymenobacter sp. B1770]|uniref:glycosyltransferase family 4 protein n=1 Tax=Hymenobacter sp. B1770 TaxID=1718788 RepID=UPI003CF740E2
MTLPNFSVLLLAWDDADPSVAVLGGSALPPTLPLVYQLAEQQPLLAVYPHLPANTEEAEANSAAELSIEMPTSSAASEEISEATNDDALTSASASAGIRLLAVATNVAGKSDNGAAAPWQSRLIGLDDLPTPSIAQVAAALEEQATSPAARRLALARSQWPAGAGAGQPGQWQSPAAPYAGASPTAKPVQLPVAPLIAGQTVREAADLLLGAGLPVMPSANAAYAVLPANGNSQAEDLNEEAEELDFDPDPELPLLLRPLTFDEGMQEPGTFEAADLLAPEDDITPDAPEAGSILTESRASESLPEPELEPKPETAPTLLVPSLAGLNFRMIQYARQAAQLVQGRSDFGVIYAPNWPAWLAALEIRNSTGQPLVLYVPGLAADFLSPAERGWLLEVERMTLRRAHVILVPDESVHRRLVEEYGSALGEVRIVPADDKAGVQAVLSELAGK